MSLGLKTRDPAPCWGSPGRVRRGRGSLHGRRSLDQSTSVARTMTLHIIRAGSIGGSAEAIWHSRTGELTGDPTIVDRARSMGDVIIHIEDGPEPIDWHDEAMAVPAVMDAAESIYGSPVDHFAYPEDGDPDWTTS